MVNNMFSFKLSLILFFGTVLMSVPIVFIAREYRIKIWKGLAIAGLLTISGTIGTQLMFFIENGSIFGISFYGAVFFVPIIFSIISLIFKIPYGVITDMCATGECIMLALMKGNCLISGCCKGIVLHTTEQGFDIRFPSREIELIVAIILFFALFSMGKKEKYSGKIYAYYLIGYGTTRFILNFFREGIEPFVWILPPGHFWSLVSIIIGITWLFISRKRKMKEAWNVRFN